MDSDSRDVFGDTETWAWRWAFLCPPLGVAYGIALLDKTPARAAQVIATAVVMGAVYVVLWLLTR